MIELEHKRLLDVCRKFIIENKISCLDDVYQTDHVINASDLVYQLVEIVGCYDNETGDIK